MNTESSIEIFQMFAPSRGHVSWYLVPEDILHSLSLFTNLFLSSCYTVNHRASKKIHAVKPITLGRKVKGLREDSGQIIDSFKDPIKKDTVVLSNSMLSPTFAFFVIEVFLNPYKTSVVVNGQTWLVILLVSLSPNNFYLRKANNLFSWSGFGPVLPVPCQLMPQECI